MSANAEFVTNASEADIIIKNAAAYHQLMKLMAESKVCFAGENLVQMKDGTWQRMDQLYDGDVLMQGTIKFLVRMELPSPVPIINMHGALLTPNHPVWIHDTWQKTSGDPTHHTNIVYNLVWEPDQCNDRRWIVLKGLPCAVWGSENDALQHPLWSRDITNLLQDM